MESTEETSPFVHRQTHDETAYAIRGGYMEYEQFQGFIRSVENIIQDPQVGFHTEIAFQCPICGGHAVAIKFLRCHGTGFCRECGIVCSE